MQNQNNFIEKALFDYYLVSSREEKTVHSTIPFYIDTNTFNEIKGYSDKINKLSLKILNELTLKHSRLISYIDNFPLKETILGLSCDISSPLWARFDTFRDNLSCIKFSEFNYDKPCTQKEIGLYSSINFEGNINKGFEDKLKSKILSLCKRNTGDKPAIAAILIDPCHYEEFHVALYLKHICDSSELTVLPVGPKNLSVVENSVYAFGSEKVGTIIRLFPVEFLYEVSNIEEILDLFNRGYISIVTDPRVIAIQAKAFFAYLWELVDNNSSLLNNDEKDTVRKCLPHTAIFTKKLLTDVLKNKDKFVIKASLGRYSEEVYIGKLYTIDDWESKLNEVLASGKIHVVQNVIDIKSEYTYRVNDYGMHIPCLAYGNFGTFILGSSPEGLCVRWSDSLLTSSDSEWMCPVGVLNYGFKLLEYSKPDRKAKWDNIVERAMLQYDFTGQYVNTNEYISLNSLILDRDLYEQILDISRNFCCILNKTYKLVKSNLEMFLPLLGIPDSLKELIQNSGTKSFCAIGRIDMVIDNEGTIKILEFNSETPAGLVESIGIQNIIKEELNIPYFNPSSCLKEDIKESFKKILSDFESLKDIKNIAFLCTSYHEDIYNTKILGEICKELGRYNVVFGNIYDLEVRGGKLYLYGKPLDAVYRYFPLDWFAGEEEFEEIMKIMNHETFSINPTHTLITQSKAIYAVIFELMGKGFFTSEEEQFINKHIPYTCLEPDNLISADCLAKPCLSREGNGIIMSFEGTEHNLENYVYQDRVNICPVEMVKYSTESHKLKHQFPVIGVYITDTTPCGIFSRAGDFITNDKASFIATFVNNHK